MDDKTTRIPSLKEFQDSRSERKIVSSRSKSMTSSRERHSNSSAFHRGDTNRINVKASERGPIKKASVDTGESRRNVSPVNRKRNTPPKTTQTRRAPSQREENQRDVSRSVKTSQRREAAGNTRGGGQAYGSVRTQRQTSNVRRESSARSTPPKKRKPISPFAQKVRRIAVYIAILLVVVIVGIVLSLTVLFKTQKIVVDIPDGPYTEQEIASACGISYEENIFMANKGAASQRLMEKFPYIKSANVYAVIPDTIKIDVALSGEAYALKTDRLTYIANEDSKVLDIKATADEVDVALIEGVSVKDAKVGENLEFESELVKDTLGEMFTLAKENGYKNITRVNIESKETSKGGSSLEVKYVYDDRIVVYLGLPENLSYKMATAQKIITEKLDVNNTVLTGELDVSMCYETKKSYFNQYTLIPEATPAQPDTQPTTEVPTAIAYY